MVQIGRRINYVITLITGLIYSVQIAVVTVQMTVTYYSSGRPTVQYTMFCYRRAGGQACCLA